MYCYAVDAIRANNDKNTTTMPHLYHYGKATVRVHILHLMNADEYQVAIRLRQQT